ncbi:MAG TPA: hypothetical protein PK243_11105 [Flexilinea sp.]|nr:hypothetical protein [Flexilinea sp.]
MISKERFSKIKAFDILIVEVGRKGKTVSRLVTHGARRNGRNPQKSTISVLKIRKSQYPAKSTAYVYWDIAHKIKAIVKRKK